MTNPSRPIVTLLLTEATRAMVLSHETAQRLSAVAGVRAATGDPATWDLVTLLRGSGRLRHRLGDARTRPRSH